MSAKKIVIVDDNEDSCKLLMKVLGSTFLCQYIVDSTAAVDFIFEQQPDLILLDYKMPGLTGVEICQILREDIKTKNTPIIFVSGVGTIDERIKAFESGADDFISKPFHAQELVLRIKARLKGTFQEPKSEISAANLRMNLSSRQTYVAKEEVRLTFKQFEILKILVCEQNQLVTRERCLSEIWGSSGVSARNVDSQINYLKQKIQKFTGRIVSVPSLGYRLEIDHE